MCEKRSNLPLGIISTPSRSEGRVRSERIQKRLPRVEPLAGATGRSLPDDPVKERRTDDIAHHNSVVARLVAGARSATLTAIGTALATVPELAAAEAGRASAVLAECLGRKRARDG